MNHAWMDDALCAQVGADLFFPEAGAGYQLAKKICDRCPVRDACVQTAAEFEGDVHVHLRHGAWGGLTPQTRVRRSKTQKEAA
ncbi:WhiB family transcriptional regulator [Streptomyces sp. BA2]|uniref:WhiB family transcriptional regulator n=1 Tax=Streptomyces sp. BA2 TaxID=436595 RepID=UPI001322436B|nr:WhiB family transcriptional regulator [Streptomyces sp. BA2]MWA08822.1 WhiB family transcriptional regulator [Streptomyces sp. BA2]